MAKPTKVIGWIVTSAVIGGGVYLGRDHIADRIAKIGVEEPPPVIEEKAPTAVAVTVETAKLMTIPRSVSLVGSLWGQEEISITAKIDGRIAVIKHDVGDVVRPGEPLLEIDPIDYELMVAEASRAFELEAAKLGLRTLPDKEFDVRSLPSVARAAVRERNASNKRERTNRLVSQSAASKEERDTADTDFEVARADHQQAILDAHSSLAQLQYRQALLQTALQKLKDTRVVAPSHGNSPQSPVVPVSHVTLRYPAGLEYVVAERSVSEGENLRTGDKLFRLVVDNPLKLRANAPERYAGVIRVGQPVDVEIEAFPGEKFPAKVSRVNPTVDRTNRTFQVDVEVPNDDRRLCAGSFAKATISTHVDPNATIVPEESLISYAGVTKLFVIEKTKVREIPVTIGGRCTPPGETGSRQWVEVIGNVRPGESVVISGQSQLAAGTLVRVRDQSSAQGDNE